jgi:hypothetical protein
MLKNDWKTGMEKKPDSAPESSPLNLVWFQIASGSEPGSYSGGR